MSRHLVSIVKTLADYPDKPFGPSEKYPEYFFSDISGSRNHVYDSIRESLSILGLDRDRFGTKAWNPFKTLIKPGDRVLIKPNLVTSRHGEDKNIFSILVHGSVIRAVTDYAVKALDGKGEIVIADSPERVADFSRIIETTGLGSILKYYNANKAVSRDIRIFVRDMRRQRIEYWKGAIRACRELEGDPEGYTRIRLAAKDSAFSDVTQDRLRKLYGADYNRRETVRAHTRGYHEYEIPNTVLRSDVILSIPKLKTHYRVGTTLNLKGFVGLNGNKNLIPHRTLGDPTTGGDTYEYPAASFSGRLYRRLNDGLKHKFMARFQNMYSAFIYATILNAFRILFRPRAEDIVYNGGCWYGNDTTWRSVADISRIIHYADRAGALRETIQRRFFSVVDGIIGGDQDGPVSARPKNSGVIICGSNLISVDAVATYMMGFNPTEIRYLAGVMKQHPSFDLSLNYPEDILVCSNEDDLRMLFNLRRNRTLMFESPRSWKKSGIALK
jgi:uncharacterized protein (DUF362 family)